MRARRKSKLPANPFWIAHKGFRPRIVDSGGGVHKQVTEVYYRLAEMLFPDLDENTFSEKAKREAIGIRLPDIKKFYPTGMFATLHTGEPKQVQAMNDLFNAILATVEEAHQSGIERGKALLIQLAKGGLTVKEFNTSVIKGEEDEA